MSTKRAVAAVLAAVVVVAAAFAAVMIPLIKHGRDHAGPPTVTAYAYGRSIRVSPARYCTMDLRSCRTGKPEFLAVPAGRPLQLSLPTEIADSPWYLTLYYYSVNGVLVETPPQYHAPSRELAVTVPSTKDMWLVGAEINTLSERIDPRDGGHIARARWLIQTNEL
jgi:hypothetical protein